MKKVLRFLTLAAMLCIPWVTQAQQTAPYNEGFEGMSTVSDLNTAGWELLYQSSSSSASYLEVNTTNASAGTHSLNIDSWDASSSDYVIVGLPLITNKAVNELQITFSYKVTSTSVAIGYLTDANDASTFVAVETYSGSSSFTTKTVDLGSAPANAERIAIKYTGYYRCYVDEVIVEELPSCLQPQNFAATITPGNGSIATLTWQRHANGTENDWVVEYGTASDFTGATTLNVSGTPTANLTGLTAEQTYYARVKADCGGDYSEWSATVSFTPTDAYTITVNDGTTTNSYVPFYGLYADSYSHSQFIIPASALTSILYGTIDKLTFYSSTASATWSGANYEIYFTELDHNVFASVAFEDWSAMDLVYSGSVSVAGNEMELTLTNPYQYMGGDLLIGFKETATSSNYPSASWYGKSQTGNTAVYQYNNGSITTQQFLPKTTISFTPGAAPTCPKPTGLTLGAITASEAPLTWTAGGSEESWKVYLNGALVATVATNSYNFTGLTANTDYTFGVAAVCDVDDESTIATVAGHTPCGAYAIPYNYGFETDADMTCWTEVDCEYDNTNYMSGVVISDPNEYAKTGDGCFSFSSYNGSTDPQYLISPQLTGIANGLHVEFFYRAVADGDSYTETFVVGYSTTDNATGSFTWGSEFSTSTTSYQRFSANYPAGTKYVAVKYTGADNFYLIIDDILFEEAASCLEPTTLTVNGITSSGATIGWTNGGEENTWDIYVTDDIADVPGELTAPTVDNTTTKPYPLTGLTPATTYYVYVRAVCDGSTSSAWSSPVTFSTECEAMNLPYAYGFESELLNVCWGTIGTNAYNMVRLSTTEYNNGSKSLNFYRGSASGDFIAVLPEVDDSYDLADYELTFWVKGSLSLQVGIMTDPTDASTFVAQGDAIASTSTWTQHTVRFLGYSGSGHYFAIKNAAGSTGSSYIDDLEVNHIPACIETTDPAVTNITAHTADLTWTGTSASYNIDYRTAAGISPELTEDFEETTSWAHIGNGTAATNNTANYVHGGTKSLKFSGATADNVIVLPATSDELNTMVISFWSLAESSPNSGNFDVGYVTDAADASTFEAVGTYAASAHTSYTQVENVSFAGAPAGARAAFRHRSANSSWYWWIDDVVIGTPVTAGDWQHATSATETKQLSGLLASTPYEVKVQGDCSTSGDGLSEWSNIVNFTTISGNAVPTGLAVNPATITSSSATASWTAVAGNTLHESYDIYWATADVMEVPVSPVAPNLISGITATSQAITGLAAETDYKVWVRDNCGADDISAWSSPVAFATAAACQTPDGLAATNVSSNSATITWNTYGQSEFNLRYSDDNGVNWYTLLDATTPYTLNGILTSNTAYQVQVQATCNTEAWSTVLNFSTPCDAIDITAATPYIEDFEAPVTTAVYNTNTAADVVVPDCWVHYTDNASYVYAKPHLIQSGASYNYSSGQVLYFYGSGNGYAALPMFSNDWSELQISFKWATESNSNGTLTLGYITDADVNFNTFTEIKSYPASSASYQTLVQAEPVYLGGLPANATRLVFRWYYSSWYGANVDDVKVSLLTKDIVANQWYAIASPTHDDGQTYESFSNVTNLTNGTYDLLRWNQNAAKWETSKPAVFTTFERGQGYIYRRSADATLTFNGQVNTGNYDNYPLTANCSDESIKGFNLLGNPYAKAYTPTVDYYKLNANGTWTVNTAGSGSVAMAEAFFVKVTSGGYYTFTEPGGAKGGNATAAQPLAFTVSNDKYSDVAYVRFGEGEEMPKMSHLNPEAPALSIPQGDRRYAIANLDANTESFALAFNGSGEYTLTASNLEGLGYLHLIDHVAGRDIDLLSTPSYTFYGGASSRFTVLLSPYAEGDESMFVRVSDSRLVIDGTGLLQVFDVMGRQLGTAQVDGTTTLDRRSLGIVSAGVYVLRLNGNSQKIVVK